MDKHHGITPQHPPGNSDWKRIWADKLAIYTNASKTKCTKYYRKAKEESAPIGRFLWKYANVEIVRNESATAIFTGFLLITTCIYAYFAFLQWDATNQSAQAALSAADTAKRALDRTWISQRPWVGLPNGVEVQGEPVFEVWSPAPDNTAIVVPVHFEISNVGASPAFGTVSEAFVIATRDVRRTPEGNSMETACSFASQNSEAGRGSVLLPGGAISMDYGLNIPYPIKLSDIRIVWICVCIVYKDSADVSHHSRFWVRSHVSDSTTPILLGQNGTLSRYKLPVSEWFIHSSDAD